MVNLLPILTGRELEKNEIIEILEESEGDNEKGRIFMDANKKTIILNTTIMDSHVNQEHQGIRVRLMLETMQK